MIITNDFSGVIKMIAAGFKSLFQTLDTFYLVGTFSLLDLLIAAMIIDMIITALFVTFNVNISDSWAYDSETGKRTRTLTRTGGSAHIGK